MSKPYTVDLGEGLGTVEIDPRGYTQAQIEDFLAYERALRWVQRNEPHVIARRLVEAERGSRTP